MKMIEWLLLASIPLIAYFDIFLAPPAVPRGFLYAVIPTYLTDMPRLRRYVMPIGLVCAALAALAGLVKWTPATLDQIVENRVIMLFCIGALTHHARRCVLAEDRTIKVERMVEQLRERGREG